jgi:Molydopterin dinucleotide binding domain
MRARVRFNGNLAPDVVWAQLGWWQACEALRHPGHESDGPTSANYNTLIDTQAVDPLSGTGAEAASALPAHILQREATGEGD